MSTSEARNRTQRTHPAILVRLATVDDIDELVELAMTLLRESPTYNKLFPCDPEATRRHMHLAIRTGCMPYIVAVHDGAVIGTISYSKDDSFSDGKCAVMGDLFVYPKYRFSPAGRMLVAALFELTKIDGVVAVHMPIAGGHTAVPTLKNMLKKFGAEEIGTIMRKVL